ncbi:hypothetical protein HMPREF0908_0539 [Selenomonas flueggei ATCC 43531]|uniref:Uncharacterized protein n=1 Tax=Selenomonas flueggei ATCC 43531 TaxID=638302 RepID=C4V1T6_9FIRM|nr:hypothetical protein HMPREF0908_0539 [Selenomonas flueggei ATCC 43531]
MIGKALHETPPLFTNLFHRVHYNRTEEKKSFHRLRKVLQKDFKISYNNNINNGIIDYH